MRFYLLSAVKMTFFWIMTLCGLVGRYERFGETSCFFYLALKMDIICFPETSHLSIPDASVRTNLVFIGVELCLKVKKGCRGIPQTLQTASAVFVYCRYKCVVENLITLLVSHG